MENNPFSRQLIEKYLAGTCTKEEKALVEGWYNQQLDQDIPVGAEHLDKVQADIWQILKAEAQPAPVRRLVSWRNVAAAASVLAILASGLYYWTRNTNQSTPPVALQTVKAPVKLNNLVELPDGSIVILDKGSTLDYPKTFNGSKTREVILNGHAYFDVTSHPGQPFIVKTGKLTTTVLGTSFDINTRNQAVAVRVITGKVKVENEQKILGSLEPNRQLTYAESTGHSSISIVNAAERESWVTQDVQLNDITFEAICRQLEQRYHVTIIIKDEALKSKRFTITLTGNDELKGTLATVCEFNGAAYTYNTTDDTYLISSH